MGWIDRLLRGYGEPEIRAEAAQLEARSGIITAAERDRQRAEERRRREPQLPWRWHGGRWERWSEMDAAFAPAEAPGTLVEHAERTGGPVDGQELVFDGERWVPRAP